MQKANKQLIGLTGGIASGKSVVSHIFALLGISIYDSDQRAKLIILHNQKVKTAIINAFGEKSYTADGAYNTAHISNIVFTDKSKLQVLNQIVHPAVFADQDQWFTEVKSEYGIIESALLFETGKQDQFNKVIVVAADNEVRIERIIKRDNLSKEAAIKRLNNQMPQAKKIEQADFVIRNNGNESLIAQVMKIHKMLLNNA